MPLKVQPSRPEAKIFEIKRDIQAMTTFRRNPGKFLKQLKKTKKPVILTIDAFKAFTSAFVISDGTGGPIDSTLFYTLYLYQEAFAFFRMGYAAALAWILVVIIAGFTAFSFLTSRYWVHYGD